MAIAEARKMRKLSILGLMRAGLLFVSPIHAKVAPKVNNAELKGDYALSFSGMTTGGGNNATPFAAVGRFSSDGAGNLTNGELDANGFGAMEKAVAQPFTGTYSI